MADKEEVWVFHVIPGNYSRRACLHVSSLAMMAPPFASKLIIEP